ncbi:hypothetical protein V6N13_009073 [Hibiscus sabdariffa]
MSGGYLNPLWEKADASTDAGFDLFGDFQFGGSSKNPFLNDDSSDVNLLRNTEIVVPSNGSLDSMDTTPKTALDLGFRLVWEKLPKVSLLGV